MEKLKLDLDALTVESFATERRSTERGTVAGQELTENCGNTDYCTAPTCGGTCYASCDGSDCGTYRCTEYSCYETCGGDCTNWGSTCDVSCYPTCTC
jgi:hypothetical protein